MVYAGVDQGPFDKHVRRPESHPGLAADNVIVSIILPSGMAKLDLVTANRSELPGAHREVADSLVGITLKRGAPPLTAADFAYTTSKVLKDTIRNARGRGAKVYKGMGFTVPNQGDTVLYQFEMEEPHGGIVAH